MWAKGEQVVTLDTLAEPLLTVLIGYLLGSIPFGLVLTRIAGLGDVRQIGSGNIGATNVLRTGRKGLAAATLLLDAAKGAAAVLLVGRLWPDMGQLLALAGLAAFLGHLYPVWLGFRGGKGVATLLGVVAALLWPAALIAAAVWILALLLTRYSSVGGMSAAVAAPVAAAALGGMEYMPLFAGFALLVLWKHRANIGRLLGGTEPKVGRGGG
ncbi:MAG: glycerol-3-phosphate 1-O-acyltransferase PlsY [Allosphingosinicella sp.]